MTTAVKSPATVGFVLKVTVKLVADAVVTVPTAPLLKVTALFAAVVLKPNPLITTVLADTRAFVVVSETVGLIVAT